MRVEFQHIDFNESNYCLAQVGIRHALAYGTDRAQMIQRIATPLNSSIKPLDNHIFMPTQPQYQDNSGGEFDIIEFAWVLTPFASANQPVYCTYTDPATCGVNWDHYSDAKVDSLFDQAASTVNPTTSAAR